MDTESIQHYYLYTFYTHYMAHFKTISNRFQMSYKEKEVPAFLKMEEFLMDDLNIGSRCDVHKAAIKHLYQERKLRRDYAGV